LNLFLFSSSADRTRDPHPAEAVASSSLGYALYIRYNKNTAL